MEIELKRLEDLTDAIVQDFADMKKREEELRDTNGKVLSVILLVEIMNGHNLCSSSIFRINKYSSLLLQYVQHIHHFSLTYVAVAVFEEIF